MNNSPQQNPDSYSSPSTQSTAQSQPPYDQNLQNELSKWNWGAFFLGWIWGVFHKVYWSLLMLIPVGPIGFIIMIILGIKGNELAWKNNRYASLDEFKRIQKKWAFWGLIWFLITFGGAVALIMYLLVGPRPGTKSSIQDLRIETNINIAQSSIKNYYTKNHTYVGIKDISDVYTSSYGVTNLGSQLVLQSITPTNYVMYAKLTDGTYWCVDKNTDGIKLLNISSSATSCQ